jgi:hypothetical protein
LRGLSRPYASDEEKFEIKKTALSNCYRMIVRYGYNDIVVTEGLGDLVYEKLKEFISTTPMRGQLQESLVGVASALPVPAAAADGERSLSSNEEDRKARRLAALDEAYSAQTVYVSQSIHVSIHMLIVWADCWQGAASSPEGTQQYIQASGSWGLHVDPREHSGQSG